MRRSARTLAANGRRLVRVLFLASEVPSTSHTQPGAVSIVARQAIGAFAGAGHDVVFQAIFEPSRREPLDGRERGDIAKLERRGVRVLAPIFGAEVMPSWRVGSRLKAAAFPSLTRLYPLVSLRAELRRRAEDARADLVFALWSPEALAACSELGGIPFFNYYGNPDHKPIAARLAHPDLFDIATGGLTDRIRLAAEKRVNVHRRRYHLDLIHRATWAGNVCALDAELYSASGHHRAFYIQNMWPDPFGEAWRDRRVELERPGAPIIGSIGNVASTGNTFGLALLGFAVAPLLERRSGDQLTIDICGTGKPSSAIARGLDRPNIRLRGWVEDIDREILASPLFLNLNNNCEDFIVGHTRFLHAWSLGACVIGHRNSARAMPEIVHRENALLGDTPEELAELILEAFNDPALRRLMGEGGRRTFDREYRAETVIGRVLEHVGRGA
jgi:glycosyltransferase involved in cell wall biosynthesis